MHTLLRDLLYNFVKNGLDTCMYILAIESSCDETSVALVYHSQAWDRSASTYFNWLNEAEVIASRISSQIATHAQYGGVIPEIGAREHAKAFHPIMQSLCREACIHPRFSEYNFAKPYQMMQLVDAIAVTTHPGLVSALRVGHEFAKSVAFFAHMQYNSSIQIIEVNHLHGHVASSFFQSFQSDMYKPVPSSHSIFPHVHMLVSGGNSQLIVMHSPTDWQIIGQTLDDAAGECFDKAGRMVGLPYPAGVLVSRIAGMSMDNPCNFPVGMKKKNTLNLSFSGLKTAVRYHVTKQRIPGLAFEKPLTPTEIGQLLQYASNSNNSMDGTQKLQYIYQVCVSLQTVIVRQLCQQLSRAIKQFQPQSVGLSGGVSANPLLRDQVKHVAHKHGIEQACVFLPYHLLTGDNAVMIALAGLAQVE